MSVNSDPYDVIVQAEAQRSYVRASRILAIVMIAIFIASVIMIIVSSLPYKMNQNMNERDLAILLSGVTVATASPFCWVWLAASCAYYWHKRGADTGWRDQ